MTESIKLAIQFVAKGVRDSIVGIAKVRQYDKDVKACETEEEESKDEPEHMSVLARRRAERMKNKKEHKKRTEPRITQRLFMCCVWNGGIFLFSILVFNGVVIPTLEFLTSLLFGDSSNSSQVWSYTGPILRWTFSTLWVLPLFVLSLVINSLWFQDIADCAYRRSRGRPQLLPSLGKIIADVLFSLLLQGLFLIQGNLASFLPIQGLASLVYFIHISLLYAMYAFEYKWFNMGWEVHKRLSYMETNWPYFVGFGLPLALMTSISSSRVISGCIFSILFPLFIISANEAEPLHETFDTPLKIFSIVVAVGNKLLSLTVRKTYSSKITVSE